MDIAILYDRFLHSNGVNTDTRTLVEGQIYLALKGENFNGNAFAAQALEKGALICILDEDQHDWSGDPRIIVVEDSLHTLQELATFHRQQLDKPVIALTGSNGKTTTKELMYLALSTKYAVHCTTGNYNNHIGVPLTLLDANENHELLIIEMGANHQKEIKTLCEIAQPDVGLITNIGKAHLEGFGGYAGVITAKTEMYDYLKRTGGTIVVNEEDELLMKHVGDYQPVRRYSTHSKFNVIASYPRLSFTFEDNSYQTGLVGMYNVDNFAAALSVAHLFECDTEEVLSCLSKYEPTNNRSQRVVRGDRTFIMDAYNANPTSMTVSIAEFARSDHKHKNLIIGDMLELGNDEEREHKAILDLIMKYSFDTVILVGPRFSMHARSFPDMIFLYALDQYHQYTYRIISGSHTLVKGSRGLRLEKVLEYYPIT